MPQNAASFFLSFFEEWRVGLRVIEASSLGLLAEVGGLPGSWPRNTLGVHPCFTTWHSLLVMLPCHSYLLKRLEQCQPCWFQKRIATFGASCSLNCTFKIGCLSQPHLLLLSTNNFAKLLTVGQLIQLLQFEQDVTHSSGRSETPWGEFRNLDVPKRSLKLWE